MAGNWFSNTISGIGKALNAPVLFDWDTNAARQDVSDGLLNKRNLSSVAAINSGATKMALDQEYQDNLWNTGALKATPILGDSAIDPNRIADYNTTGSGVSAATMAAANPYLASLDSLDTILANKNAQSQAEYDRTIGEYNAADALDRAAHDKSVQQNETALTSGNQAALLNAANGAKGLRGVLASLGALGGSGLDVISRLVGLAANQDTGGVRKNFEANADSLNTNWAAAEQKQRQRRADADATRENNMQNNKANVLTSRQDMYQKLANIYGAGTAEGANYASRASALAPEIAATTRASVAPYAAASNLFTPQALRQYLAGTQNLNTDTSGTPQKPINSPLFGQAEKKKDSLIGVA